MKVLLDSNVISESVKATANPHVMAYLESSLLYHLSVVSIFEIRFGAYRLKAPKKQQVILDWVSGVETSFGSRILEVNTSIAKQAARLRAQVINQGFHIDMADALIAATSLEHGLTLATRNTKDFEHTGVSLINPWEYSG